MTGRKVRLPTEAEWEWACRAGTTTKYFFGDKVEPKDANFYVGPGENKPKNVGSYPPNAFGLHDMHGNVAEWVSDWHARLGGAASADPKGPTEDAAYHPNGRDKGKPPGGPNKVLRGGAFAEGESNMQSSFRNRAEPLQRNNRVGFRIVIEAE